MTTPETIMAVDPDISKSGLAVLRMSDRHLDVCTLPLYQLVTRIEETAHASESIVIVEASWLTRHNWHLRGDDSRRKASRKGYDTGANHDRGKVIVELLTAKRIEVVERCPLRKCWKGRDGKITHEELMSLLEGSGIGHGIKRTNQEERDAALLALDASGIALRMNNTRR